MNIKKLKENPAEFKRIQIKLILGLFMNIVVCLI